MDTSYACDVCMEPLFWFVDNFTYAIGPLFVGAVVTMTASVVAIAYWLGLPYWWQRNSQLCVLLMVIGNWLLVNISFHYYMAVVTPAGYPPQGELITEAVSICKKCIAPKPPRTHHCSVCNRCILKMDHHCPWLNNCVGYKNHRYFFMYMAYMVAGVLFLIIFGAQLAIHEIWFDDNDDGKEITGQTVAYNESSGSLLTFNGNEFVAPADPAAEPVSWRRRAVIYMALLSCGVLFALGGLVAWHSRLVCKGETSIEANINRAETTRLALQGRIYVNPYNFGATNNWRIFLGIVQRSWCRHVFLPSGHEPSGDGLTWLTIHDESMDDPIIK